VTGGVTEEEKRKKSNKQMRGERVSRRLRKEKWTGPHWENKSIGSKGQAFGGDVLEKRKETWEEGYKKQKNRTQNVFHWGKREGVQGGGRENKIHLCRKKGWKKEKTGQHEVLDGAETITRCVVCRGGGFQQNPI